MPRKTKSKGSKQQRRRSIPKLERRKAIPRMSKAMAREILRQIMQ